MNLHNLLLYKDPHFQNPFIFKWYYLCDTKVRNRMATAVAPTPDGSTDSQQETAASWPLTL